MKFNLTAHRQMWLWLAENPDANKWNWPGWERNGGIYKIADNSYYCFACEYAGKKPGERFEQDCSRCPLIWVWPNGREMVQGQQYLCEQGSCYKKYKDANNFGFIGDPNSRTKYATMVANLQVKEGVEVI